MLTSLADILTHAMRSLAQNWLRSLLTLSGIVIGVTSIVTLVAILQGVKAEIRHQLEGLGANLMIVTPSRIDANGPQSPMAMLAISTLTERDVDALRAVPGVVQVSPVTFASGTVEVGKRTFNAAVVGTNRDGVDMNPTRLAEGRYFSDTPGDARTCVLTEGPRKEMFGDAPAIGRKLRVMGHDWTVVGALRKPDNEGTLGSHLLGLNTLVYIPVTTLRRDLPGAQINRIVLKTDYQHPAERMVSAINATLKQAHGGREDFGVITQEKGLALVIKLINMAQSLLVLVAAISLFVAGVGIMNIMLVTVTERTREIGVRKTVGARRSDIFYQFLAEAVTLSLIGGGVGLLISGGVCLAIARLSPLTPIITPWVALMAIGVCAAVGVLFGVTPAVRAARLDPIVALRHE